MNALVIEKNIPIPPISGSRTASLLGALRTMEIGDSIFLAGLKTSSNKTLLKPKKFTARKQIKDGVEGVRIWRIE